MKDPADQGADRNDREPEAPRLTRMQIAGKGAGIALVVLVLLIVIAVLSRM